jgi:endonuclease/exonuclease/phosphatase family metal-dependent hydrolase
VILEVGPSGRRDQLRAILDDAADFRYAVVGGDMNSSGVGKVLELGYQWPTKQGPATSPLGRWDHLFLKGLAVPDSASAGTVLSTRNASDHRPVWAIAQLR